MSLERELHERSESKCELCGATDGLEVYTIEHDEKSGADASFLTCNTCTDQIDNPEKVDPNHWRCLNDSMWSTVPSVQVMAWRMLNRLKAEGWPQDLLDMMYLEDELLVWAKAYNLDSDQDNSDSVKHIDSNGVQLASGDNVVLIKDLNVKGTSMVAKRGTAVRGISLVYDNEEHIEGRVNGQQIVILTKFVKKN